MNKILNLKQFVPSEFCIRCYGCCRFREKESVWAPLGIELIPYEDYFTPAFLPRSDASEAERAGFICPNLDLKTNLCRIYPERPFDCRLYPFLLNSAEGGSASGRRKEDKFFLSVHLNCLFIRENLKKEPFKRYTKYLKEFFLKRDIIDFLKRKPELISEYPPDEILDLERLYEINRIKR